MAAIVEDHIRWTDVMDFVITRYNHLMDIPEEVCRRAGGVRCRHDFPRSVQAQHEQIPDFVQYAEVSAQLLRCAAGDD